MCLLTRNYRLWAPLDSYYKGSTRDRPKVGQSKVNKLVFVLGWLILLTVVYTCEQREIILDNADPIKKAKRRLVKKHFLRPPLSMGRQVSHFAWKIRLLDTLGCQNT